MAAPSLVVDVQNLSKTIGQAVKGLPRRNLYKQVVGAKPVNTFLFELKILFSLISHLSTKNWSITVENLVNGKVRLPRAPGSKGNFTYFSITHPTDGQWHLVHGTDITTTVGNTASPDISLQDPKAGHSPRFGHVKAMWDAKLRDPNKDPLENRISNEEYCRFVWVRDKLTVPRPGAGDPLNNWPPAFEVSGLITNGDLPYGPEDMFLEDGVSSVRDFRDAYSVTYPRRKKHVAAKRRRSVP